MGTEVDEKVVEMRFDNRQFEKNVQTSMSTIDKLKQKLKFSGASKGLENIGTSVKNTKVDGLSKAVEEVGYRFKAMEVIGITALANITNSVINTGKQLIKSITIDPVRTGFNEYELKMNSIQTILSGTGEKLNVVKAALEDLNTYSDRTIYSFQDMTSNIGKFTNNGVKLEDAVTAMKGISNEAALAGANANEASRAMYNISQSLSTGYMQYIDWKSIENANMATMGFKKNLVKTGLEMGTLNKKTVDSYKNISGLFKDELKKGWLTNDVMLKTLANYADETTKLGKDAYAAAEDVKTFTQMTGVLAETAQSGWAQTWELVVGDFAQSKKLFTNTTNFFSGLINKMSDARNNMLSGALTSKWSQLKSSISDTGIATKDFRKALIKTADDHSKGVSKMIKDGQSFAETLKTGWMTGELVSETLKKFTGETNNVSKATSQVTGKVKDLQKVVNSVINGKFGTGEARIKALTKAGYDYKTVQSLVNKTLRGEKVEYEKLTTTQMKNLGYTKEQIKAMKDLAKQAESAGTPLNKLISDMENPSGRTLLKESFSAMGKQLALVFEKIKESYNEIFTKSPDNKVYKLIKAFHKMAVTASLTEKQLDNIKRVFKGLFAAMDIVRTSAGAGLRIAFYVLKEIFGLTGDSVLDIAAAVGDLIVRFRDWIKNNSFIVNGFKFLIKGIVNTIKAVKDFISSFVKLPETQKNVSKFTKECSTMGTNLGSFFKDLGERVKGFISRVKQLDSISLDGIKGIFKDFKDNVLVCFSKVGSSIGTILGTIIENLGRAICKALGLSEEFFDDFKGKVIKAVVFIKDKVSEISFDDLVGVGLSIALIKLARSFKIFSELADDLGSVLRGLSAKLKSEAIFKIALSVGILVASVALLAQINKTKIESSLKTIAILIGLLVVLAVAVGIMQKVKGFGDFSKSILALSGSLLIIVKSLDMLSKISMKGILPKIVLLIGVMTLMVVMAKIVTGNESSKFGGAASGILLMAASFRIIVSAFKVLSKLNTDSLYKNATSLVLVFGAFSLVMISTRFAGKDADKAGIAIQKLSSSLLLIAIAMKIMGTMKQEQLKQCLRAVEELLLVFAVVVAVSKLAGKHAKSAGDMLSKMAKSMIILSLCVSVLSYLDPSGLKRAVTAIAILEICLAGLIAVTKLAKNCKGTLMSLTITIGILAASIYALSSINPKDLKAATIALNSVILSFGLLLMTTKLVKKSEKSIGMLLIVTASLAGVMLLLSTMPVGKSIEAAISISILLTAMIGSLFALSECSSLDKSMLGTIAAMVAVVAGVALIVGLMSGLKLQNTLEIATSLSIVLLSLSACVGVLTLCGLGGMSAMYGIAALIALISSMAGLFTLIGGLTTAFPFLEKFIDVGIPIVEKVAQGIGKVIGDIIGGVIGGVSSGLPIIADNLTLFIEKLQPFITAVNDIPKETIKAANSLAKMILIFTAAKLVDGITSFITKEVSFSDFSDQMPDLAKGVARFAKEIDKGKLSLKTVKKAALCGELISNLLNSLPKDDAGSVKGLLVGITDISSIAADFGPLAKGIVDFSDAIGNGKINKKAVDSAGAAGDIISKLVNALPKNDVGSIKGMFDGFTDISSAAADFGPLAKGIVDFSEVINNTKISSDSIDAAGSAGKIICNLVNSLPKNDAGSIKGVIDGVTDIAGVSADFGPFGKAIADFSKAVKNKVHVGSIQEADTAGRIIIKLSELIPKTGALDKIFGTTSDMEAFGKDIAYFGEKLSLYSEHVSTIESGSLIKSAEAVLMLVKIKDALNDENGTSSASLQVFGEVLSGFGQNLNSYYENIKGVKPEKLSKISTELNYLLDVAKSAKSIKDGDMDGFISELSNIGKTAINRFIDSFKNSYGTAKSVAAIFIGKFIDGFKSRRKALSDEFKTTVTGFLDLSSSELRAIRVSWYGTGRFMVDGFINGISENISRAEQEAKRLLKATTDVLNKKTNKAKQNTTKDTGKKNYSEIITSEEVDNYEKSFKRVGSLITNTTTKGFSNAMATIATAIDSGIDSTPTIRPVMDLSDIKTGTGTINSMLSSRRMFGLNLGTISSMMNTKTQVSNSDVVSAIDDLRRDIGNLATNSYSINGITYSGDGEIQKAVQSLVNAIKIEGRK